jgi:hypothetical protein
MERSLRSAATAFGRAPRASDSSKSVCRCKFEGSTKSRSMILMLPTPARTRRLAAAAPIAPQPTMAAREASNRCCPCGPIPAKSIWREYFSWKELFTKGTAPAGRADTPAKLHDSANVDRAGNAAVLPFV